MQDVRISSNIPEDITVKSGETGVTFEQSDPSPFGLCWPKKLKKKRRKVVANKEPKQHFWNFNRQ